MAADAAHMSSVGAAKAAAGGVTLGVLEAFGALDVGLFSAVISYSFAKTLRKPDPGACGSKDAHPAAGFSGDPQSTLFVIIYSKFSFRVVYGTIAAMAAHSLLPRALYEEVAELLRQRIFDRALTPGSWIDELKIAEEYGISRTPLREALKVLATEGLVTMKVRRGAYVTEVNEKDLTDVYHLLSLLESDAAAMVAETATQPQLDELQALHQELALATADRERFFLLNEAFHSRLLAIADNRWRDQMVLDLRKVMKLNRHNSLLKAGRIDESLAEHGLIMSALVARDSTSASQHMRAHFASGLQAAV